MPADYPSTDVADLAQRQSYVHTQLSAQADWIVTHNMGTHPAVMIVDSADNLVIGDVYYVGQNSLLVSFSAPFSGKAYLR